MSRDQMRQDALNRQQQALAGVSLADVERVAKDIGDENRQLFAEIRNAHGEFASDVYARMRAIEQAIAGGSSDGSVMAGHRGGLNLGAAALQVLQETDPNFARVVEAAGTKTHAGRFDLRAKLPVDVMAALTNEPLEGGSSDGTYIPGQPGRSGMFGPAQSPLDLLDLLPRREVMENTVEHIRVTFDGSPSEQIAEGDAKAMIEGDGTLHRAPIVTIAGLMPASVQAMADHSQLMQLVDSNFRYRCRSRGEHQLINGSGDPGHIEGLLAIAQAHAPVLGAQPADYIGSAIVELEEKGFSPTIIVLNPSDWFRIQILKSTQGEYVLGSPRSPMPPSLWNRSVVVTNSMPEGTGLVLDPNWVTVLDRQQPTVSISNSHADYFARNLMMIRVEMRLGLEVTNTEARSAMPQRRPGLSRIKAAVLDWLGIPVEITDAESWQAAFGPQSVGGVSVNHGSMLTLSAVWACTRLVSQSIASLPLSMYERTSAGKRVATGHPLHALIHDQPNSWSSATVFWESIVATMLLRGTAYVERLEFNGRLVGLRFLPHARLTCQRLANGAERWLYLEDDGRQREIPPARIWTIPGFSLDGRHGASVIRYGASVFGTALAADRAAASTFEKGLMPTVALKYPKVLQPKQRDEARTTLKGLGGALNAGNPVILEAETEIDQIGINPEDAQLLQSRGFSVEEVCRWFGVDPTLVGHGEKASHWGTGLEQKLIGFLTFTLAPLIRRIEQAIAKDLLPPAERRRYYPKASVEGLLRADSAGRAAFYGSMVDHGILTRDEVRELEDREPMGGNAAQLTVQAAMVPLNSIGQRTRDQVARAAMQAWLKDDDSSASAEPPAE